MTADEFNTLEIREQIKVAMANDTLIGHRSEGPVSMHLYVVDDFYVEITYTTRRKAVINVHASKEDAVLDPYLEQIDLSELFL